MAKAKTKKKVLSQKKSSKTSSSGLRVAVAQINTILGNFQNNREKIQDHIRRAVEKHCDIVIFPESTIFGYHPFDLLEREALVDQQLAELTQIEKEIPEGIAAIVGVITKNPHKKGRPYFNSSALVIKGQKTKFFHKELLPTGDVFDEARFIESGSMANNFFTYKGKKIFLTICEDIWAWEDSKGRSIYPENPLLKFKGKKVDLVLNQSASPFYSGKLEVRKELVRKTAQLMKAPMIYANLVGAQDEIIFDGASFCLDAKGKLLMQSLPFEEDLNVVDFGKNEGGLRHLQTNKAEILRRALVLGIRDFCKKTGLAKVHLGLSGGIDSALVACLAVDALGPGQVRTIALPTQFNAKESTDLARQLAKNLGTDFIEVPIQTMFETAKSEIDKAFGIKEFGLVHENMQARLRGLTLMSFSNLENSLLLATSNKSEAAAGYATLYGDMCGGLAPIGDLTKEQVVALCELYNADSELIPRRIIDRPPSAELRPNQKDEDSLPPYKDLDQSVVNLVENNGAVKTATDRCLLPMIMKSEFKRWQMAPILKLSKHSFGRGRRYPVAHQAKEI